MTARSFANGSGGTPSPGRLPYPGVRRTGSRTCRRAVSGPNPTPLAWGRLVRGCPPASQVSTRRPWKRTSARSGAVTKASGGTLLAQPLGPIDHDQRNGVVGQETERPFAVLRVEPGLAARWFAMARDRPGTSATRRRAAPARTPGHATGGTSAGARWRRSPLRPPDLWQRSAPGGQRATVLCSSGVIWRFPAGELVELHCTCRSEQRTAIMLSGLRASGKTRASPDHAAARPCPQVERTSSGTGPGALRKPRGPRASGRRRARGRRRPPTRRPTPAAPCGPA